MKNFILIAVIVLLSGCQSIAPYSGPTISPSLGDIKGINHRVEPGQTLWKISRIYNVDIDDILRLNHISDGANIEVGQILLIPRQTAGLNQQQVNFKSAADDFIWPLKGKVIAGFGSSYRSLINKGINIQACVGAQIYASRSGRVVFYADNFGNFGKTVIIDHGDNLRSVYSRAAEVFVRPGDNVQKGALIGRVGSSARDKNSYLYFEIRKGALPQNPLFYLS
jgi:murein DD-endopeptidase MepM/ murein hydrolase activator NlpD